MRATATTQALAKTVAAVVSVLAATGMATPSSVAPSTSRISSSSAGVAGDGPSDAAWCTADCRYVVFPSSSGNLVPGDTNFASDVFLRDRLAGATERISVGSAGEQANYPSGSPTVTADGRYVAFASFATNLVPGDTNGVFDVFVRDRQARTTTRVDLSSDGYQGSAASWAPAITPDGHYVTFTSDAANLVPGDTNGAADVFIRDLRTGVTRLVSTRSDGGAANGRSVAAVPSADGRYVAFESAAGNLVPGDTNDRVDAFVKDLTTGTVARVGVTEYGKQFPGGSDGVSMSADGRRITFVAAPPGIVPQLFVHDRTSGTTTMVSVSPDGKPGTSSSYAASISGNGRYVAFNSGAGNLVPGAPGFSNTLIRDLQTRTTTIGSRTSTGAPISQSTIAGAMSDVGVTFLSGAANVVPGGGSGLFQVYFHAL
jgi:Tol biopolymer transport system component